MDFEDFDDQRPRYRLCQLGFGLMGLAIGLLCADLVCGLAYGLTREPALRQLLDHPAWTWVVSAPITGASLLGAYLLWGRWTTASWQRRAGLLALMCTIDLAVWGLSHAATLGFEVPRGSDHQWLIGQLTQGMGWVEFILVADLASALSAHLGKADAPETGRSARALATIGVVLWAIDFGTRTDWSRWPLEAAPIQKAEQLLLVIGGTVLSIVTTFQVTVLCMVASRQCRQFVAELDRLHRDPEALRSRSETEADEFFRR